MKKRLHPSAFGVAFVSGPLASLLFVGKQGCRTACMHEQTTAWDVFFSFHVTLQIALSLLPHACHSSCCAPGKKCWSLGEFSVSSLKSYSELIIFLHEGAYIKAHLSQPGRQKGMLAVYT